MQEDPLKGIMTLPQDMKYETQGREIISALLSLYKH